MQNAYRNRSGPGPGAFFMVALGAFAVVFALGLFRPDSSVSPYVRIQQLAWQFSNLRSKDFSAFDFGSWRPSLPTGAVSAPPPEARAEKSYKVVAGDTLTRIADRFGVTAEKLSTYNGLRDPNQLDVGQTLRIPAGSAIPAKPEPVADTASARGSVPVSSLPPVASAPMASISPADALLAMAEEELSAARFDRALHTTEAIERLLLEAPVSQAKDTALRSARMHVVRATAYAAVGHHQQVQNSLTEALAADPTLELDPLTTSPKLLQALELARELRTATTAGAETAPSPN